MDALLTVHDVVQEKLVMRFHDGHSLLENSCELSAVRIQKQIVTKMKWSLHARCSINFVPSTLGPSKPCENRRDQDRNDQDRNDQDRKVHVAQEVIP